MRPVWDVFGAAVGRAIDVSREMVTTYLAFLRTLGKWSIGLAVALLPLPIVGSLLHASWMNGLYVAALTLIVTAWLMAAFPLITLARYTYSEIRPTKKTAQLVGGILFWALLAAMYFYLIPVWTRPATVPFVLLLFAILAVAFARFGIGINPKLAVGAVFIVLFLTTVSFIMPASCSAAAGYLGGVDRRLAERMTSSLHPAPKGPQRIEYDLSSIDTITFFDPLTSEPRVWYYAGQDGGIELFDSPGFHLQYGVQLESITPAIVAQIRSRVDADVQEKALEETRRKEEAQRVNPKPPHRIQYDYTSIEKIVFFDPVTADPRVWYYKAQDGRIELFDGPGYHPQNKEQLKPATPDVVGEIRRQLLAHAQEKVAQEKELRAAEARRRVLEAEARKEKAAEREERKKAEAPKKPFWHDWVKVEKR